MLCVCAGGLGDSYCGRVHGVFEVFQEVKIDEIEDLSFRGLKRIIDEAIG